MRIRGSRLKYQDKLLSDMRVIGKIRGYLELDISKHNLGEPIVGYGWVWDKEDQRYYMQKGAQCLQ